LNSTLPFPTVPKFLWFKHMPLPAPPVPRTAESAISRSTYCPVLWSNARPHLSSRSSMPILTVCRRVPSGSVLRTSSMSVIWRRLLAGPGVGFCSLDTSPLQLHLDTSCWYRCCYYLFCFLNLSSFYNLECFLLAYELPFDAFAEPDQFLQAESFLLVHKLPFSVALFLDFQQ